jgi:hypothetical protein
MDDYEIPRISGFKNFPLEENASDGFTRYKYSDMRLVREQAFVNFHRGHILSFTMKREKIGEYIDYVFT